MTNTVTEKQAREVLAAITAQFASYLDSLAIDGTDYGPTCPPPTLDMDYDGTPAIVWEDGPDEWAYRAAMGGTSEEERVLTAQAADEFGVTYIKPADDEPATLPAGVSVEPLYSFVLGIYPA